MTVSDKLKPEDEVPLVYDSASWLVQYAIIVEMVSFSSSAENFYNHDGCCSK